MIGKTLGHYEITGELGKGGMGEVWRAKDTKLGREVAIKTLPEAFAQDEARLSRFEREARLLAPLNRPNIGAIYGLEEFESTRFLVLELIEGDTLADRLQQGPIPVEESLQLALQITEALEAAHDKGVIHRDLKPANIKITPDGKIKVLDFGLAKAFAGDAADPGASNSPTLSAAATQQGVILGTAAYMSPEQAKGIPVDKRSDIFSFGCVLFEMLTGRQAFQGELATEILASVIRSEPDYTTLQANLHPRIKELLRRCFEKDVKNRWQAVGNVRVEIASVLADPTGTAVAERTPTQRHGLLSAIAASAVTAMAVWFLKPAPPAEPRPVMRFHHELAERPNFTRAGRPLVAISPDGTQIVYVAASQLHLRDLDDMAARPIPGTDEDASGPLFSPDGHWVGFFSNRDGQLKKIPVTGGAPVTLCYASQPYGASWGIDGTILYAQPEGVLRVSANGGAPEVLVEAEEGEQVHGPHILPGGKSVLFTTTRATGASRWDEAQIVVESLDTGERKVLWTGGADARYVPTGHIVYALDDDLLAFPFDVVRLEVSGGPVPLVEGMRRAVNATASAHYGFSERGSLVYGAGGGAGGFLGVLALADRSGVVSALDVPPANYRSPRVSPDGKNVAVETQEDGGGTIWVYALSGESAIRRLTHEGDNIRPIWTPDSERVTFASDRDGGGIFWTLADGSGVAERLLSPEETGGNPWPESWSPDARTLSFRVAGETGDDVWTLSFNDGAKPEVFAGGPGTQGGSSFSPDGKWLAYVSGGSGQTELFVEPFPKTGARHQVSRETAWGPVWAPDGSELFYRVGGGRNIFKSVEVTTDPAFTFTNERVLPIEGFLIAFRSRDYDITPDGERFVFIMPAESTESGEPLRPRIHIVVNWFEELKERVPVP